MISVQRGSSVAFLHHLGAPGAHFWVTPECRAAAGQQLDFIERPHGTGPHFQETPQLFFIFFSFAEAAAA